MLAAGSVFGIIKRLDHCKEGIHARQKRFIVFDSNTCLTDDPKPELLFWDRVPPSIDCGTFCKKYSCLGVLSLSSSSRRTGRPSVRFGLLPPPRVERPPARDLDRPPVLRLPERLLHDDMAKICFVAKELQCTSGDFQILHNSWAQSVRLSNIEELLCISM